MMDLGRYSQAKVDALNEHQKTEFSHEEVLEYLQWLHDYQPKTSICGTERCPHTCCNLREHSFVIEVSVFLKPLYEAVFDSNPKMRHKVKMNRKRRPERCSFCTNSGCMFGNIRLPICYKHHATNLSECKTSREAIQSEMSKALFSVSPRLWVLDQILLKNDRINLESIK